MIAALFVLALPAATEASTMDCREGFNYRNYIQIDADPIELSKVEGVAKLESGEPIEGMCVALFSQDGKKRLALTKTNKHGQFRFKNVQNGSYRLVTRVDYDFLCSANHILAVRKQASRRPLSLTMRSRGIDQCSDVEVDTEP